MGVSLVGHSDRGRYNSKSKSEVPIRIRARLYLDSGTYPELDEIAGQHCRSSHFAKLRYQRRTDGWR
jgi:hypothetical protein